jgi:hypothetical protein
MRTAIPAADLPGILIGTLTDDRHDLAKVLADAQHQCPFHYTASDREA